MAKGDPPDYNLKVPRPLADEYDRIAEEEGGSAAAHMLSALRARVRSRKKLKLAEELLRGDQDGEELARELLQEDE